MALQRGIRSRAAPGARRRHRRAPELRPGAAGVVAGSPVGCRPTRALERARCPRSQETRGVAFPGRAGVPTASTHGWVCGRLGAFRPSWPAIGPCRAAGVAGDARSSRDPPAPGLRPDSGAAARANCARIRAPSDSGAGDGHDTERSAHGRSGAGRRTANPRCRHRLLRAGRELPRGPRRTARRARRHHDDHLPARRRRRDMAEACGKLTGRPGIVMVTRGPAPATRRSASTTPRRTRPRW